MATQRHWNGAEVQQRMEREMGRRLDACRILVTNHAKKLISVEGAGQLVTTQVKLAAGGGFKFSQVVQASRKARREGGLIYGAFPSAPGEPPHLQTGRLRGSVASERQGMVARVGTNIEYGRALELGIENRLSARPWLRRALIECTSKIHAIMDKPIR